jgi:large subunit ribosomal protein L28
LEIVLNISPRLKKLKKSILIKSPFIKKAPKASPSKSA